MRHSEQTEVDYIIVGAGSAGCILANRLSADPRTRVLLIEAGGENHHHPYVAIPGAKIRTFGNPRFDWNYWSEPDETRDGRTEHWPRGLGLGGSSLTNGLIYVRGQPGDFDAWAEAGNLGWRYKDLLPMFKRLEATTLGEDEFRGRNGPIGVRQLGTPHPLAETFIRACEARGLPRNEDYNGRSQEGVGLVQTNQRNGIRESTARAYLDPVHHRQNLIIWSQSPVSRLVFSGQRVVGVEGQKDGRHWVAKCAKEVIVSAGALGSPQLLMLSGLGDASELKLLGIEVVKDLPGVGKNLFDHAAIMQQRDVNVRTHNSELSWGRMAAHLAQWLAFRTGLATIPGCQALAFCRSDESADRPDLQLAFGAHAYTRKDGRIQFAERDAVSIFVNLCRPKSRGTIALRSASPADAPSIRPRLLADEYDRRQLARGCQIAEQIFASDVFAPYLSAGDRGAPGSTIDEWLSRMVQEAVPYLHPAGTCKMGIDGASVVDPSLRVHSVVGLRVADASIMPSPVSGNTNAAAMMIGEKAAELILLGDPSAARPIKSRQPTPRRALAKTEA